MTSPVSPPGGPQKKPPLSAPEEPNKKLKQNNSSPASNRGFDPMLNKLNLSPKQREHFFQSLMREAANSLKTAFQHFVATMRKNRKDD